MRSLINRLLTIFLIIYILSLNSMHGEKFPNELKFYIFEFFYNNKDFRDFVINLNNLVNLSHVNRNLRNIILKRENSYIPYAVNQFVKNNKDNPNLFENLIQGINLLNLPNIRDIVLASIKHSIELNNIDISNKYYSTSNNHTLLVRYILDKNIPYIRSLFLLLNTLEKRDLIKDDRINLFLSNINRSVVVTPLIYACYTQNKELVKILLENEVDVNETDENGNTALFYSSLIVNLDLEIINLLLNYGANVNIQNKVGYTALMDAVEANNLDLIRLLLAHRANPDLKEYEVGETALFIAVEDESLEAVKILILEGKANINLQDEIGNTALMNAINNDNNNMVEFLLENGADVSIRNENDEDALDLARENDNQEVLNMLEWISSTNL
ncbi:ankyrin repeat domain-containing protein [Candidatus Babela massiliensis]|uniref:Ankyrin repeats containing protein n=1 Tax=Candidatus Babela massiliensis TaxID=673862 RepID=V6DHJ4_9BACT|nr:ankyrin repeat domain-containing protein [Candidatus Babela massiliensis]CDK31067.1 Ankyrin repeats containing protein [Candidatus Babela massiliensis]